MKKLFWLFLIFSAGCTRQENLDPKHKVLSYPLSDDCRTLDSASAYDSISLTVMQLSQESLFQFKPFSAPLELEPLLAEAMPALSKDKKTYTIKIKRGVSFQDDPAFPGGKGRELQARDFIYGWKRLLVPALQSGGTWIFEDKVAGYSELKKKIFEDKATPLESLLQTEIEGFRAVDNYTIQIKLLKPYPQLLDVLAMGFGAPVAAEVVAKYGHEGLSERMVGTGPYRLKSLVRGSKIVLEKNPGFRGENFPAEGDASARAGGLLQMAGQALPFIPEIQFHVLKEEQPAWLKFQKGELDVSVIPKDNFSSAIQATKLSPELEKKEIRLQKSVSPVLWYFAFNMKDKLLGKNLYLRRAILKSINRDQWIELFLNGRGIKATGIIPAGLAGHVERTELPWEYNLEEAKQLLVKAGYPGGKGLPPIRFDLRGTSPTHRQQGEFVAKALSQLGIQAQVESNTFPAFLEKEKKGNLQLFLGSWVADYPDAENFLQLLYSKNAAPGPNYANYANPAFDLLFEKLAVLAPAPERDALIRKAEDIALGDAVWSAFYYPVAYSLSHAWVKNYRPNSIISNGLKYLDLDFEKKKTLLEK